MACCQRSSGMGPDLRSQLVDKLRDACSAFPSAKYCCVLTPSGQLISSLEHDGAPTREMLAAIASLKRAAMAFASTLNQNESSVIHIAGDQHLFSCYEIGENLVAFYSEIDNPAFNTMDMGNEDAQVMDKLSEVRLLMQNIMTT